MNPIIGSTLWITLIGMGLVFIAILILWGLMEIVVRATSRATKVETAEPQVEASSEQPVLVEVNDHKVRAAAVAVAYALSIRKPASFTSTPPAGGSGSAWSAVMRSFQINSRGQLSARKSRGK